MEKKKCVHLIIQGRVQGVGYRAFTKGQAKKLNVDGWVRNLTNGNVEAVISGTEENIAEIMVALYRGPLAAKVSDIRISQCDEEIQQGFKQLPTA